MLEFKVVTEDTKPVKITSMECVFRFFQLEDYLFFYRDRYETLDVRKAFGIDFLKPGTITSFIDKLSSKK